MKSKPIVEYIGEPYFQQVGEWDEEKPEFIAHVYCIHHPLLGSQNIRTSLIINRNLDNNDFETQNTIYRKAI